MALTRLRSLLLAALSAALLSGCVSEGLDTGLESGAGFALADKTTTPADEATIELPETMVVPSSYASPSAPPVENAPVLASVDPAAIDPLPANPPPAQAQPTTRPLKGDSKPEASHGDVDRLIAKYAALYEVPEMLVRRVVKRESNFYPGAYNKGHWGLMQIKHATARGMGYGGPAKGLLDAETNLKYAVKYLRGAWLVAEGDQDRAVGFYARGYYYDAKRMGLLDETGLGKDRKRRRS